MPPPACTLRPAPENIAEISAATPCEQQNIPQPNSPPPRRVPTPPPTPSEMPDHVPFGVRQACRRFFVCPETTNRSAKRPTTPCLLFSVPSALCELCVNSF